MCLKDLQNKVLKAHDVRDQMVHVMGFETFVSLSSKTSTTK